MTNPKDVSVPDSRGALSPPRGFPLGGSTAASASSDLLYYKRKYQEARRKYQEAYRQDIRGRIQSLLSDLIQMNKECKINDDTLAAVVALLLTAMAENEVSSCVESLLNSEPSIWG